MAQEYVCEETGDEVVLMKDRAGHVSLFYIYDSHAAEAIREFSSDLPRPSRSCAGDDESASSRRGANISVPCARENSR